MILEAGGAATAHIRAVEHPGVEVELLPEDCTVGYVKRGGVEDIPWVDFFIDDAVSADV